MTTELADYRAAMTNGDPHGDAIRELAEGLWAILRPIQDGTLSASPAMRLRLEGAVVALEALDGASVDELIEALKEPPVYRPTGQGQPAENQT